MTTVNKDKDNKEKCRMMKAVFCLKSGKSIVSSMFEKECFKIYNQWAKQKDNKASELDKIVIEKKRDNKLVEVTAILISEIVGIQITESNE